MKAVGVDPARREVRLVDHPEPAVGAPDEVKVRILEVGVCGTDREICRFQFGEPPPGQDYLVLGHEALGEVVETGPGVTGLRRGDLVVPMVRLPCPSAACGSCRHERQDYCETDSFPEHGIRRSHGFMTSFVVERERYLFKVPSALRAVGVLVEPLTIAEKALLQVDAIAGRMPWRGKGGEGRRAVVIGAGAVGILGAMALKARGYETTVYSRGAESTPNAELARSIGAVYVSSARMKPAELAASLGGVDLVYEAVGAAPVVFELLDHLGTNGVFMMTGVPGADESVSHDLGRLMRNLVLKNQVIAGTVNAGRDAFEGAIRDLEDFHVRWPQALARVVAAPHPLEGFRDLLLGKPPGIKQAFLLA
jgi:threonine dehydrogenase-like Zn-dependent dehydrogenase